MRIKLCIPIAPIGDLIEGYKKKLSDEGDAIQKYMGCDPSESELCPYLQASPAAILPIHGCEGILIITAEGDKDVPINIVQDFCDNASESAKRYNQSIDTKSQVCRPELLKFGVDCDHYK